jgi:hypothetical protein
MGGISRARRSASCSVRAAIDAATSSFVYTEKFSTMNR